MFIDERLLECVTFGTASGPAYDTRRVPLKSGIVRRNPRRARPQYRFNVLYKNLSPLYHQDVVDAFNACLGGVHSFRFKDWTDFEGEAEVFRNPLTLAAIVGTGGSQALQLTKTYTFGSVSIVRLIRKPVMGTVVVRANGTPISSSISSVGVATFTATGGAALTADYEFDTPVMFENDELPFSGDQKGADGLFLNGDVMLLEDLDV